MTKVGFIVEGLTEFNLIQSASFNDFLTRNYIELVNVIDAKGCNNLLPHNIEGYIQLLENNGAEKIVILTDQDQNACITSTKDRINARPQDIVIVAVQQIESWFLACTPAMRKLLNNEDFHFPFPEEEQNPFETINRLIMEFTRKGFRKSRAGKKRLVNLLLNDYGLDLTLSAAHPACPSVQYFLRKVAQLAAP